MGTTADKLTYLSGTKDAIKAAIEAKGVTVPDETAFRGYAALIEDIAVQDGVVASGTFPATDTETLQSSAADTKLELAGMSDGVKVEIDLSTLRGLSTQFTWGGAVKSALVTVSVTTSQITITAHSGVLSDIFSGYKVYGT